MTIIPDNKQNRLLAADYLRLGKVVAYPTDTVYGIGCNPYNVNSVKKIYEIKSRAKVKILEVFIHKALLMTLK